MRRRDDRSRARRPGAAFSQRSSPLDALASLLHCPDMGLRVLLSFGALASLVVTACSAAPPDEGDPRSAPHATPSPTPSSSPVRDAGSPADDATAVLVSRPRRRPTVLRSMLPRRATRRRSAAAAVRPTPTSLRRTGLSSRSTPSRSTCARSVSCPASPAPLRRWPSRPRGSRTCSQGTCTRSTCERSRARRRHTLQRRQRHQCGRRRGKRAAIACGGYVSYASAQTPGSFACPTSRASSRSRPVR